MSTPRSTRHWFATGAFLTLFLPSGGQLPSQPVEITQQQNEPPQPIELPKEIRDLIPTAFAEALNKQVQKELGDLDKTEIELVRVFERLFDQKSEPDTMYSLYIIKPGKKPLQIRDKQLKKDGHTIFRYTCVAEDLPNPLALVTRIDIRGGRPMVDQKLVAYDNKLGWHQSGTPARER